MQRPRRNVIFALKAIGLTSYLSGAEKRVATALLDHFNHKTTQCDPSLDRVATLLGIHRRTVIRGADKLASLQFFRKIRHGGHFHRNSYEPNWERFTDIEKEWSELRDRTKFAGTTLSPSRRQISHRAGDDPATQTCLINQSQETLPCGTSDDRQSDVALSNEPERLPRKPKGRSTARLISGSISSAEAQVASAERRWNSDVMARYLTTPDVMAAIVDLLADEALRQTVMDAEMKYCGGGIARIERLLCESPLRPTTTGASS